MPASRRYPFTEAIIAGAPPDPGVYALWEHGELIYYGRTLGSWTLRQALRAHLGGRFHACTARATHYSWEICANPVVRELELLQEYRDRYARLPRCNAAAR
jgi:hypothetical protein